MKTMTVIVVIEWHDVGNPFNLRETLIRINLRETLFIMPLYCTK